MFLIVFIRIYNSFVMIVLWLKVLPSNYAQAVIVFQKYKKELKEFDNKLNIKEARCFI